MVTIILWCALTLLASQVPGLFSSCSTLPLRSKPVRFDRLDYDRDVPPRLQYDLPD